MELVVLVNEQNHVLGTMPKSQVHTIHTPLHRAFSAFIFNSKHQLLFQQRSHYKKTWPLSWSNTCCGHPGVGESHIHAIRRRLKDELGLTDVNHLRQISPYRYQFTKDGVMENEICPIFIGFTDQPPQPEPQEVEAVAWISWPKWLAEINAHPDRYSPWCIEETYILKSLHSSSSLIQ